MDVTPQAGQYRVIYADPPWRFATYSDKGKGRSAEAHYDCLSIEQVKAIPVRQWVADDAVLLLWATDPMLPRALEVIEAWGFTYKTVGFYWVKLNKSIAGRFSGDLLGGNGPLLTERDFFTGLGFWTRANPEPCLLATRGHPKRLAGDVPKLLLAPRREHSRKPDEAYQRIERLLPGPYLELFARQSRPGWDSFGNQPGLFDRGPVMTRRRPSREADARRRSAHKRAPWDGGAP
jgi:N6-adenosine-specific RNA methylase IME4